MDSASLLAMSNSTIAPGMVLRDRLKTPSACLAHIQIVRHKKSRCVGFYRATRCRSRGRSRELDDFPRN